MIEQTNPPGTVEMVDDKKKAYYVDEMLFHLIKNRRVWTDPKTKELMIDDVSQHQTQSIAHHRLAVWWYRIMSLNDLPRHLKIGFWDDNPRNLVYKNLVRLYEEEGASRQCLTNPEEPLAGD